jgi:hypothetical protein
MAEVNSFLSHPMSFLMGVMLLETGVVSQDVREIAFKHPSNVRARIIGVVLEQI